MLLAEFNSLPLDKKSDLVWEWGHYLASCKRAEINVALFILQDFFVEVHISCVDNRTTHINGVSKEFLAPELMKVLNHDDPFVKLYLGNKTSSAAETV